MEWVEGDDLGGGGVEAKDAVVPARRPNPTEPSLADPTVRSWNTGQPSWFVFGWKEEAKANGKS